MLCPGGAVEQKFRLWRQRMVSGIQQQGTDGIGNSAATRLSSDRNLVPRPVEVLTEAQHLGCFATPLDTF